jgi:SAM-dependent methyltransferase
VYEVGIRGPLAARLSRLPHYRNSFYWHDVPPGSENDGIQCQDSECLTFEDRSFDLVLSQDVLEHVPNLRVALSETYRVLKLGGAHIFTVKAPWPWPEHTIERTRRTPEGLEHILPPKYYPSANGAPSLLFRDIGADVIALLNDIGFTTLVLRDFSLYPQIVTLSLIALRT